MKFSQFTLWLIHVLLQKEWDCNSAESGGWQPGTGVLNIQTQVLKVKKRNCVKEISIKHTLVT